MTIFRSALACLAFSSLLVASAEAATLHADYSVSIRGFPVGKATITAEFAKGRYSIAFTGGVSGLARLFSDAETTATATGRIGADRLEPKDYSHVWIEDNETETVAMRFAKRGVTAIDLAPPREHPERYVPLSRESEADALDPVSAFLWPIKSDFGPATCDRSLPLIDGKRRFDISLSFSRTAKFTTRDGYRADAVVCSFRYHPVAGQRISGKSDAFMADSNDAATWIVPVADGLAAPVRIEFRTRAGRVVLNATAIRLE
jgi:hypothetical protein